MMMTTAQAQSDTVTLAYYNDSGDIIWNYDDATLRVAFEEACGGEMVASTIVKFDTLGVMHLIGNGYIPADSINISIVIYLYEGQDEGGQTTLYTFSQGSSDMCESCACMFGICRMVFDSGMHLRECHCDHPVEGPCPGSRGCWKSATPWDPYDIAAFVTYLVSL
jgi:hypothetical protein